MTRYLVLVALIMGSVAAPVAAAPADAGARLAMVSYADCLMQHAPNYVERFLRLPPESRAAQQMIVHRPREVCITGDDVSFGPMGLRGSLYDLMYRRNYGGVGATSGTAGHRLYCLARRRPMPPPSAAHADYLIFADCVIRANPAAARAVMASEPASPEEGGAFSTLKPAMAGMYSDRALLRRYPCSGARPDRRDDVPDGVGQCAGREGKPLDAQTHRRRHRGRSSLPGATVLQACEAAGRRNPALLLP